MRPKSSRLQTNLLDRERSPWQHSRTVTAQWIQLDNLKLCSSSLSAKGLLQLACQLAKAQLSCGVWRQPGVCRHHPIGKGCMARVAFIECEFNQAGHGCHSTACAGCLPLFNRLDLSFNPPLDAAAFKLLSAADWPDLTQLILTYTKLDVACVRELVQTGWVNLNLACTGLDADAIAVLATASWPSLSPLDLRHNELGVEAMAHLVLASFPQLRDLQLDQIKLNAAAAKQLAKGNWPLLDCLLLSNNYLNDAAMFHLSRGDWPLLQWLNLQHNKINALGIEFLTHSSCEFLAILDLDSCLCRDLDTA